MFKNIKKKIKKYNYKGGNFLNYAPKTLSINQIKKIKKKKLNYLNNISLFYKNKDFHNFFWEQILNYISKGKINDKFLFLKIKKNFDKKNLFELISIYNVLLIIGKFSLALKVRVYFFSIFKKINFLFKTKYIKKIESVDNFLQLTNKKKLKKNKKEIICYLKKKMSQTNSCYEKYIKKKSIGIYGVGTGDKNNFKDLKNYDVVAMMNLHSNFQYKNIFNKKISYYSDFFIKKKKKLIKNNINLDFMITKLKTKKNKYKSFKLCHCSTFDDLFFGTPSLLINMTLDLISRTPKKIKIFNSTLYLPIKGKIFNKSQKKYYKFNDDYVLAFGTHDLISEFIILKNLLLLGLIDVDKNLSSILKLDINNYVIKQEKSHKKTVLKNFKNSF